ncbi:MAG: hypothetical protein SCALA702_01380 [Melioribacteraceae bacterium]|nr:MAG: hypothetical protein SCALA702_01380 [Melioribacteraceae bacterium]
MARKLDNKDNDKNEVLYEELTVMALRQLSEIYQGCNNGFMDKDQFIMTYLNGLGEYEKEIAKKHGIEIEP